MNVVAIVGRLTRDPELRHTPSGTAVCEMRIAVDRAGDKQDDGKTGPGFFDVEAWDKTAENVVQYLAKGRQVAVSGRLKFREWEAKDGSGKRSKVEIVANQVTFVGGREDGEQVGQQTTTTSQYVPAGASPDFAPDDDIPF